MHTKCTCLTIVLLFSLAVEGQQNHWQSHDAVTPVTTDKAVARRSFPTTFKLFDLNTDSFRQDIFSITDHAGRSTIILLPNADGAFEQFEIFEASNFVPELQAQYPAIRAFSGRGITDKYAMLKLSISPQGIQTMVFRAGKETEFIEAYSADHTAYAVFKSQRRKGELPWTCSTIDTQTFSDLKQQIPDPNVVESSAGELRTMRLAQSVTAEYSNYFGATSAAQVALVLAAINATLTRCNGVYEKDLAVHLNLIAATTNVIYYNPATDPYSNAGAGAGGAWNGELQSTLTSVIGEANYDIGHLFGASGGGGNAGCIGCVCVDGSKGSGFTSPADAIPQGDNFDIDYVVHEVGHQMGANHTFSMSTEGGSVVQKEVGSGITIMGYAGITNQDVAPHSIDIYHEASIAQIQTNLASKTCPVTTNISANNATPVVGALTNYTIPISTPFALTGSATDANGDPLTYCWEQNDNTTTSGANSVASPTKLTGPNWLSFSPSTSPTRTLPILSTILAGLNVTPPLPGGDAIANIEALSSVARTLNFRLTVRDNCPYVPGIKVGQTNFKDMVVTVTATSGPFSVTSPNTTVAWGGGTVQTVTWNVASTTAAPVSCANVKISLSFDGGQTFPTVLIASTANDGSEAVTLPVFTTSNSSCRIKVEAVGNIFFDISNTNFTITAPDIQFETAGDSKKETTVITTGCRSYKDYTVNMKVNQPLTGTGSAIATINIAASPTATQGVDFDFTTNGNFAAPNNTIAFAVGGASLQPFTIRIYDDASVESFESFTLNYTLNAGSTDARPGTDNQTYTFTITDNDIIPHGPSTPLATFGSASFGLALPFRGDNNDARTQILLTAAELNAAGFYDGTIAHIAEIAFNVAIKQSTIPYAGLTIKMKNTPSVSLPGGAAFESGATTVYTNASYSTVAGINNFILTTPFQWDSTMNLLIEVCYNNANGSGGRSAADFVTATSQANNYAQSEASTTAGVAGCTLATASFSTVNRPDITLKQEAVPQTAVEQVLNSIQTIYLGPYTDIYVYSAADGDLIARIENLGAFDYGCTQVIIDRAGTSAVPFWNNTTANYLLQKSIKIIPTNNTTTGNYKLTLYYTAAEVNGWQSATGGTFTNNQVIKVSNGFYIPDVTPVNDHIADVVITGGTSGSLGTDSKMTAQFSGTGFSGFGVGRPCSPLSGVLIWTGAVNTDWANPGNWACGVIPGPASDVQINGGLINYPVIHTNVTIKSLLLRPGSSYTVSTGMTLTITQ